MLLLCALIAGSGSAWADEGDELAICQGTGSGYGTRRTLTDSHSVGWVLSTGQSGYLGTNNATNHNNVKPTAADLPVVKAVKSDASTTTTGYYFYYTTTAVANVGSLEFSYTANSGNSSATAYVVVGDAVSASGGDAYEIVELSTSSTTAQNASLGTSGTFTYTFKETQKSAKYYGFIIVTSSNKRLTGGTIKLLEGQSATLDHISITGQKTAFYEDDTFEFGGTVTAHYDDSSSADVTEDASFSGYDMSTTGNQTVTVSYGGKTTTYDITVNERPKFTVTYSDGGSVTEESVGAGVTLASRSNAGEYTFLGWTTENIASETTVVPTYYTGTYHPTDNITLYPVYKRTLNAPSDNIIASVTIEDYASDNSWTNSTKYGTVEMVEDAISVNMVVPNNNTGQYNLSSKTWRMYQSDNSKMTVNAETGYELVSAKFTYAIANTGVLVYNGNNISSGTSVALSGTASSEFSVGQTSTATNGQVQISAISVTYRRLSTDYYISTPITSATITLASACTDGSKFYGTYSSSHGFVVPSDLTVSEISVIDGKLYVEDYDTGDIVPANTGVMIASSTAGEHAVTLASGGSSVLDSDNMLIASGDDGVTAADMDDTDYYYYRLTMADSKPGFWWKSEDGAGFVLAANKAYLKVLKTNATASARGFSLFDDETTGITSTAMQPSTVQYYDLQGRRVAQPTKGLYIVNGKKVVIR